MGSFIIVISTWALYLLSFYVDIPSQFRIWYNYGLGTGAILSLLDTALPFIPLENYNGKRIWNFNKIAWLLLAIFGVAIFIITFFFR